MRPNIIFILSDQLRRAALSCYGDPNIQTSHIDQLAADGVRFTCTSSTSPICVPYRFTLMTGQPAHTRWVPGIEYRMSPAERTLADEFNDANYETVYVGKWHLDGGAGRKGVNSARSCGRKPIPRHRQGRWQKWRAFELRNDPYDTYYFEDDDPTPRKIEKYQTDGLFELAMDHLEHRESEQPFACVISVEPPHPPFVAPPELEEKWADREIVLRDNFQVADDEERARRMKILRTYYAMVENLDNNVGQLRAFLEKQGIAKNTILVFTADHGEMAGSHGIGEKQVPFEESVGVPLIVVDPRRPQLAGKVVDDPTCTEDLYPTLLGLCDLVPAQVGPGQNLTPVIRGEEKGLDREAVQLEFVAELRAPMKFHDCFWRGIRTKTHKYTVKGGIDGAEPWQLFDLEADPFEMNNLVEQDDHRDLATRMHEMLLDKLVETDDDFANIAPAFGHPALNAWQD